MTERTRRSVLRGVAAASAAGVAAAEPAAAQSSGIDYGGWFDNVGNFDGTVDKRGRSEVTVRVGASGNGGPYAFDPAAVHVDPGTTVVWEWTGDGSHDVAAEDGSFDTELVGEKGHTFSHAFESAGITKYACTPHKTMGMKGAVVVGDPSAGGSGGLSMEDRIVAGSGLGLAGVLLAAFARAVQNS
ncbi:MAG: halocyanin domain-containing protein [Halobacteriaceae archaeon]